MTLCLRSITLTVLSMCQVSFVHHPFHPCNHPPRNILLLPHFTEEETKAQRLRTPKRNQST